MYTIKDLGKKQSPAIRLKIVVQIDWIDFGMYILLKTFQIIYDTLTKAEN